MKLNAQISTLHILSVVLASVWVSGLSTAVHADASKAAAAAAANANIKKSPFTDAPAIATLSEAPKDGDCGSASSKKVDGLTAWDRGYQQAMSGTRYKIPIQTKSGTLHPERKACFEYHQAPFGAADVACCMAGFGVGYGDLQQILANSLSQKKPAPETPDAMSCYHSFGEGKAAANLRCEDLKIKNNEATCRPPKIGKDNQFLGCASLGYLAELNQCPAIKSNQKLLKEALDNGALCNVTLAPDRGVAGEGGESTSPPPVEKSKAASGLAPDTDRDGGTSP